jgi:hypothetical protein
LYVSLIQLDGVDFWLLAKIGEIISKTGSIPDTLLFPFTEIASEKFNAHEWLACLIFNKAIRLFGEDGMPFFTASLALVYFSLTSYLAYLRGKSNMAIALFGGIFAIATENYRHTLRPELIALSLMAVYWIALEFYRKSPGIGRAVLVALPVLIWVNVHGSFVLAPILLGMYVVGTYLDQIREGKLALKSPNGMVVKMAALTVLVMLTCLVNPFGWELIKFVLRFSSDPRLTESVMEWTSTFEYRTADRYWLMVLVWIITLICIAWNYKKVSMVDVIVFVAFTYLALRAIRFPVYLGMVAAYVVPANLVSVVQLDRYRKALYQGITVVSLVGLMFAMNFGGLTYRHPYSNGVWRMSSRINKWMKDPEVSGNVLTAMETGPELIYNAYPRLKPSIDARIDSYGFDYFSFQKALLVDRKLRDEFVERYDVRYVLLPRHIWDRLKEIDPHNFDEWEPVVIDYSAALLRRSEEKRGVE